MSLMLSRRFHAIKMTLPQRACYWAGFLYYVTTALDVVTIAIPSLLMLYFVVDEVSTANYVYVLLALIVRQALIPFIAGNSDSLVNLARIQMTYSFAHLVQIFDQLRRHHDDGWVATGAATSSGRAQRIIRTARVILIGTQLLMVVGLIWRVPQYGLDNYWAMILFAAFNFYVTFPIMLADARLPHPMQVIRNVTETGRTSAPGGRHRLVARRNEAAA
jgi:hypothetical protein